MLALPHIAVQALVREVDRIRDITVRELGNALSDGPQGQRRQPQAVVQNLANAVGDYRANMNRTALPKDVTRMLPDLLYSTQQLSVVVQSLPELSTLRDEVEVRDPGVRAALDGMELSAEQFLDALATQDEETTPDDAKAAWEALETHYAGLRRESLDAAAMGRLSAAAMNPVLRYSTMLRRSLKQTRRASARIADVQGRLITDLDEVGTAELEQDTDSGLLA